MGPGLSACGRYARLRVYAAHTPRQSIWHRILTNPIDGISRYARYRYLAVQPMFFGDLVEFVEHQTHHLALFPKRHKGRFKAVNDQALDFVKREMEYLAGQLVFFGNRRFGDQSDDFRSRRLLRSGHCSLNRLRAECGDR